MNLWWVCLVGGLLVAAIEVLVPGFTVIWFGVAGILSGIPVAIGAPAWVTLTVFGVSLLLLTTLVRGLILGAFPKSRRGGATNVQSVVGAVGIVIEAIDPVGGAGKVRVGTEVWTATSHQGTAIPARSRVRVLRVTGVRLVVEEEVMQR